MGKLVWNKVGEQQLEAEICTDHRIYPCKDTILVLDCNLNFQGASLTLCEVFSCPMHLLALHVALNCYLVSVIAHRRPRGCRMVVDSRIVGWWWSGFCKASVTMGSQACSVCWPAPLRSHTFYRLSPLAPGSGFSARHRLSHLFL